MAGEELVERIKPHVRRSMRREVLGGIGGFGALVEVPLDRYRKPVLVSGTDGVGAKLKAAEIREWMTDAKGMTAKTNATRKPDMKSYALPADDLDATLARLAEQGIEPEKPPYRPGGRIEGHRICFVRDPDGYRIELIGE